MANYCTAVDLDLYLSAVGVGAFADHEEDPSTESDVIEACIERATEEINSVLRNRYDIPALANNALLKHWSTVMACRFLCIRRGNMPPESLEYEYREIVDRDTGKLIDAVRGKINLLASFKPSDNVPSFSNLTVDRRYIDEKVRVRTRSSNNIATKIEQDRIERRAYDGG
jgi:phage gp36-like protein